MVLKLDLLLSHDLGYIVFLPCQILPQEANQFMQPKKENLTIPIHSYTLNVLLVFLFFGCCFLVVVVFGF